MSTHELTTSVSNGPLTSNSYLFGAVDGSADAAPDAFNLSLVYDYVKSLTDTLYPTLAQYNSVLWLGRSMPTTGFADAVDATGLVTKSQAEAIAAAAGVNYVGLPVLTDIDQDNDLIQIYDVSAAKYYSVTPAELRSDVGLGTEDSPTFSGLGLASGAVINWGDLTLTQSSGLLTLAGGNLAVPDDAYAAGWNGSANVPTKNAVYDKIELILGTTLPATYQPLDADLTAVAAFASTGIAVRTASNTWAQRSMANAAAGITWTNPAGVAGDFTPVLANDLAALEGLGSTGFAVRSTTDTWVQRSVAVSGAGLSISNGDGVSGNPTISLADDVAAIEALTPTNDDILQRKSGAWTNRTMAQLIADLAALGTTFQPLDSDLTSWAGVTRAAGFDTFTATPSSANLAALLTDETGSGLAVFNNSPTFITPVLGVASATSVTVGNTGLIVGASTPFSDSAGTLTLQNVDALDATTESTIEAAIDTLANLTSIQGRTVTLADAGADAFLAWDDSASAYQNLSAADATAILNAFIGDSGSGGTKGLVPAPASGDSGKFLKGNGTWASVPGGGDALTSNPLSQFAATTSAQLRGVISDETGTGSAYFQGGDIGTPSAGVATNITGLPISTGVSGLGTNVATRLAVNNGIREKLTADRTYYVRTDGSNSNTGLANTAGGAFLTIQYAIDHVATLDTSIYQVTISVQDATWTENLVLAQPVGAIAPILRGNTTTPANCLLDPPAGHCIAASGKNIRWTIEGFKFQGGTGGSNIYLFGANITLGVNDWGATGGGISWTVSSQAYLLCNVNQTISAGQAVGFIYNDNARIDWTGGTVTLSGTPDFSAFCYTRSCGTTYISGTTFSGSATGSRYNVILNGAIITDLAGATYLPGNAAGTTSTGGQYL